MTSETNPEPNDTGGFWRLTDNTHAAGLTRGWMWLKGAMAGLAKARTDAAEPWGLWLGVLQCVQSVYHVRKCVVMATANVPDDVKADITGYLAEFDKALPELKTIRDVLEHYEDGYALGKGHLQQPEKKPWERTMDAALSEDWTIVPDYADADQERPIVTVAGKYVLDLSEAARVSEWLLWKLWERTRHL
jgi:hypothetical protein